MNSVRMLLTLLVSFGFGYIGKRLKIPAGAMVFGMIGAAVFNLITDLGQLPSFTRPLLQVFGGAMIGHTITMRDVKNLKRMWFPALIMIAGLMLLNVGIACIMHYGFSLSLSTALFAGAPGGVSDMALIADELGADSGQVSVLQLFRLVGICLVYPVTFKFISKRYPDLAPKASSLEAENTDKKETPSKKQAAVRFCLTLLCASAVGFLLNLVSMPAAFMVGGVIGSCAYNLTSKHACFPNGLRYFVQAASGGLIGIRLTMDSVLRLPELLLPILVMFFTMLLFTLLLGYLMHKLTRGDLLTNLMGATPGGVQEMSLIAQDLNCDTAQVVTLHTVRIVVVICLFPLLLEWLAKILP